MSASNLDKAIEADDLEEVKRLVEAGANLSHMGAYDSTPLSNAVFWNQEEVVGYLITAGARPSNGGCTSTIVRA